MKHKELLTELSRSETLSRVSVYSGIVAAYAAVAVLVETRTRFSGFTSVPADLHAALTLVLGWLLVFRTNTSYSRWWEARTLWGGLVNCSRTLAVKITQLVHVDAAAREASRVCIVSFAWSLKDHLRDGASLNKLEGFQDTGDQPVHVPSWIVARLYGLLRQWTSEGRLDGAQLRVLDEEARRLLDICGGCERIRNTRLARSYRLFARQCVFLYLVTLPWGIVESFQWWTIPLTAILSYFMLGLETVAEHVEEPFGHDEDDLDLEGLCRVIELSVNEIYSLRNVQ